MAIDAEGFVLAGGRSSRMGSEKALVEFAGEPLVAHALRILRGAGLMASIAGARSPLDAFAPVVPDSEPDRGPLGGICAALESLPARWAVFVSVDAPLLPSALITFLLEEAQNGGVAAAVAEGNGFAQTFPAVVDRVLLPALRKELDAGRAGCLAAFQAAAAGLGRVVKVVPVEQAVRDGRLTHPQQLPAASWFLNVNTQEDLARAEACLRGNGFGAGS